MKLVDRWKYHITIGLDFPPEW